MKTVGIIAEYNPLHEGHLYQIRQVKKLLQPDVLVILLSGYFSSRGLPSLLDRKTKTEMALAAGADLVLDLPVIYACQSADRFALYAIESLKCSGVQTICFGSETADLSYLETALQRSLKIKKDPSRSLVSSFDAAGIDLKPNDILGLQYLRWCKEFGIEPYLLQRDSSYKSATATRNDFFAGIPQLFDESFHPEQNWNSYYPVLRTLLLMQSPKDLSEIFLVSEGIENRLKKAAQTCYSWQEFLESCVSKTYTRARIQRTCLFILLQLKKEEMKKHESCFLVYVRGMNSRGQKLLSCLPAGTPIASRISQLPEFIAHWDIQCKRLYESVLNREIQDQVVIFDEKAKTE